MTIAAYGRHTERATKLYAAQQAERTRLRKEREASQAALERARADIERMESQVRARQAQRELARMLDDAANRVAKASGGIISQRVIERRICRVFGITREKLLSENRSPGVAFARQAVMYWSARLTSQSIADIGGRLQRDRSTVRNGVDAYIVKRASASRTLKPIPKGRFGGNWRGEIVTRKGKRK